ncbi:MAG: hypothetical protein QXP42_04095 [Candidatus Micrarchaeia archaeon]
MGGLLITGGKITYVEAKRDKDDPVSGLSINVGIDDVVIEEGVVEVKYTYTVNYTDGVGSLKIVGSIYAEEEPDMVKRINDEWTKNRRLPDDFAETIINSINYACGTNGTLVVRPLNLAAPMIPPRVRLEQPAGSKRG